MPLRAKAEDEVMVLEKMMMDARIDGGRFLPVSLLRCSVDRYLSFFLFQVLLSV
jgi:hypothetical protein